MSNEIGDNDVDTQPEPDIHHEETIKNVPVDEQQETETELCTSNGRETPSAISFSDVIVEKQDEPEENVVSGETHQLLQIIADKSNKEAISAILNTVTTAAHSSAHSSHSLLVGQWRFRRGQELHY